jgi:NitT/TauT family transport system permease protein
MKKRKPTLRRLLPWIAAAALFGTWELVVWLFNVPVFILPAPSAIVQAAITFKGVLMFHAGQTLMTTLIGIAMAMVVGLVLGIAIGCSPLIYETLYPLLIAFNAIPKVAVVPILVIWCGIGSVPAVLTAFIISFFPIVVNTATGLATVEPEMRDVLRALGATRYELIRKVGIPRALPYFFASLKIAITLGFIGSVVSETIASNDGIGFLMLSASTRFQVPIVFAALIVVAAMSVALYALCVLFERRMTGWAFRGNLIS